MKNIIESWNFIIVSNANDKKYDLQQFFQGRQENPGIQRHQASGAPCRPK